MNILSIVKEDVDKLYSKNKKNNIGTRDEKIREFKKGIIKQFNEKPTTDQILQKIIDNEKSKGYEAECEEQDIILKNIVRNIFNNSASDNISKQDVESVIENKKEVPEYKITVNSRKEMSIKTKKEQFKIPETIQKLIRYTEVYRNEDEIAQYFEDKIEPILDAYTEMCNDMKQKDFPDYKIEEFLLKAEQLLTALNNMKIRREDLTNEKIKVHFENGRYIARNEKNKAQIELDFGHKMELEKLQNNLMEMQFWKYIYQEKDTTTKKDDTEISYALYSYIRDLGIKMAVNHDKKNNENMMEFEFSFGGKREINIDDFKKIYSIPALPYTDEMIKDYEYCYEKKYDYKDFLEYITKNAQKDQSEKRRNKEIKEVKRNYDYAQKRYDKIAKKTRMRRTLKKPNYRYALSNMTIKESEEMITSVEKFIEYEKNLKKRQRKTRFKRKIYDGLDDIFGFSDDERAEDLIEESLKRIGMDVKDICTEKRKKAILQLKLENAGMSNERKKLEIARLKEKRPSITNSINEKIKLLSNAKYEKNDLEK